MSPETDVILYGDELADGMWVLPEDAGLRHASKDDDEDTAIRRQRFRQVTRKRITPGGGSCPDQVTFIGAWVDGYQEVHTCGVTWGWLVRKDSIPGYGASTEEAGQ
jgi:hypothetical protein